MSQKSIAAVLILVATALGAPPAINQAVKIQDDVVSSVVISGPTEVVVGELVELTVAGSRPSWLLPTDDCYITGNTVITSFRQKGEFQIIASAVAGGSTCVTKHTINVVAKVADTDDAPEPTPEPDDVVLPNPDLTKEVLLWCKTSDAPVEACKKLGNNFIDAASRATTTDDLLARIAKSNRAVNQKGCEQVLAQIQQYLFSNLQDQDFEAHRCAFSEIGDGFKLYSEGK